MNIELKREKNYLFSFLLGPLFGAVIIMFLMFDAAVVGFQVNNAYDFNVALIKRFEGVKDDADISMIMMGNSRLRYAATFGFEPEELVSLPDGRQLATLKFATNAAGFYNYSEYADRILEANPDYIVMMDSLFTNMRPPEASLLVRYSKMVYQALQDKFYHLSPEDSWNKDRHDLQMACYLDYDLELMNSRIESTASRDSHNLDPDINSNRPDSLDFVDKALQQGIKVIIIHVPSNRDVLNEYNVPSYYIDSYGLDHVPTRQELLPNHHDDVIWMDYRESEGRDVYCDFLHLNERGRKTFTTWFLNEIQDM